MTSYDASARVPVDLDVIADYLEGVLPAAESAEVAARIAADDAWASMYEALRAAMPAVGDALSSIDDPGPMPADVADRLTTALRGLAPLDGHPAAGVGSPPPAVRNRPETPRGGARPGDGRPPRRDDRRRFGETVWAKASIAVAAVAVVFGVGVLVHHDGSAPSAKSATGRDRYGGPVAAAAPDDAPGTDAGQLPPGVTLLASGHDYGPTTLGRTHLGPGPVATRAPGIGQNLASRSPLDGTDLVTCLAAVTAAHGGHAVTVDVATYQGVPALIVTLASPGLAVAVGRDCGRPGAGEDELASAPTR